MFCTQTPSLAPAVSHANISSAFVPILTCDITLRAPPPGALRYCISKYNHGGLTAYLHRQTLTTWKVGGGAQPVIPRHIKTHLGGDQINRPLRFIDMQKGKLSQMGNRFTFRASSSIKSRSPDKRGSADGLPDGKAGQTGRDDWGWYVNAAQRGWDWTWACNPLAPSSQHYRWGWTGAFRRLGSAQYPTWWLREEQRSTATAHYHLFCFFGFFFVIEPV